MGGGAGREGGNPEAAQASWSSVPVFKYSEMGDQEAGVERAAATPQLTSRLGATRCGSGLQSRA